MHYINIHPNPGYWETMWWIILSLRDLFILGGLVLGIAVLLNHIHLKNLLHVNFDNKHKI